MHALLEICSPDFVLRNSLYASILLGAVLPLVGIHLVVGNRVMLALALPEAGHLGVALTAWTAGVLDWKIESRQRLYFFACLFGSLILMSLILAALYLIRSGSRLGHINTVEGSAQNQNSDQGVIFISCWAGTLALAASNRIPELGLLDVMRGEILAVSAQQVWSLAAGFAVIVVLMVVFTGPLKVMLFDSTAAYAMGLPAGRLHALSMSLVCSAIALGSLCAGPLPVFAFLIIPPVTIQPFVKRFASLCWGSALVGVLCSFAGFYVSYAFESWNLPTSAAQIICLGLVWLASRGALILGK